nr:hypothetical protein [Tanacetum cinerariifolium]
PFPLSFTLRVSAGVLEDNSSSGSLITTPFLLLVETAGAAVLDTCSAISRRVEGLENDKAAQQLEIVKFKARVKKLEKINKVKSSKLS